VAVLPIETRGLRKEFRGPHGTEIVAVEGLDLAVAEREFIGLLGPNGAGKSTTIGMLTTRVIPTAGTALIMGVDVVKQSAQAKRYLGVVPQTNTLDRQLTVVENLEFHGRYFGMKGRAARARAGDLLDQFRLADRADAMVQGLSGGLAQRLMIARALVHKPDLLFLDEPTSGIDPQTRLALWDLLRELHAAGQTILLTTHYMEEADTLCSRVAVIDHGKVLADGDPADLKRSLGSDTVVSLTLTGDGQEELLREARGLDGVHKAELTDGALRVFAADSGSVLSALVPAAVGRGIRITEATSQPPTLEAVFLSLTGRELRE
jgi:ABC-2 type transport system ATP-binding protein